MPWLLTRGNGGAEIGYRVAGFISERWPTSNRNGGRHRLGTGGRHASESANYAFEHLEIGTYRGLIGLAERAGDRATHRLAESILAQELEMAGWLEANLARIAAENLPSAEAALNSFR